MRVAVNEEYLEIVQVVVLEQIVYKGVGCQRFRLEFGAVETRGRDFLLGLQMLLKGFWKVRGEQTAEEQGQERGLLEDAEGLSQQVEAGVQLQHWLQLQ